MKSVNTIINEIRKWIADYQKCKDSASIDALLDIQDEVAIRSFTLASYVAEYKTSFNASYFIRKIGVAKASLNYQKSNMTIGRSEAQALIDNAKEYEHEQEMEATAIQLDLLLKQTNVILSAMSQRISYYKQEKNYKQNLT